MTVSFNQYSREDYLNGFEFFVQFNPHPIFHPPYSAKRAQHRCDFTLLFYMSKVIRGC